MTPKACLIDLDDTLISAYGRPELAWRRVAAEFQHELGAVAPEVLAKSITDAAQEFWGDQQRHRIWRQRLTEARRNIVAGVLGHFGADQSKLSELIADRYSRMRDEEMHLFPHALDVLAHFRDRGVRLCLITNGGGPVQRAKIERFGLSAYFDHIQIEGEHGFGKPEEKAYLHALSVLESDPKDAWIIGDNLEWEVRAPQRLGIHAIWFDGEGRGIPHGSDFQPNRIIRSLSELLPGSGDR